MKKDHITKEDGARIFIQILNSFSKVKQLSPIKSFTAKKNRGLNILLVSIALGGSGAISSNVFKEKELELPPEKKQEILLERKVTSGEGEFIKQITKRLSCYSNVELENGRKFLEDNREKISRIIPNDPKVNLLLNDLNLGKEPNQESLQQIAVQIGLCEKNYTLPDSIRGFFLIALIIFILELILAYGTREDPDYGSD